MVIGIITRTFIKVIYKDRKAQKMQRVQKVALFINGKQVEILNTVTFNLEAVEQLQNYTNIFLKYAVQKYISGRESPQLNLYAQSRLCYLSSLLCRGCCRAWHSRLSLFVTQSQSQRREELTVQLCILFKEAFRYFCL